MRMTEWCERCGADLKSSASTMSIFNTQTICMACKAKERAHPQYERAREAEAEAVRRGDYNFHGVGKPADL